MPDSWRLKSKDFNLETDQWHCYALLSLVNLAQKTASENPTMANLLLGIISIEKSLHLYPSISSQINTCDSKGSNRCM